MQRRLSAFKGYTIEAPDGNVGFVSDILFEDNDWKLRWFVIRTGSWLSGRTLLLHPSALERPDILRRAFPVTLTKAEVEASPDIASDPPVALQMDEAQHAYYAYNPVWDEGYSGVDALGMSARTRPYLSSGQNYDVWQAGDAHLRSLAEVTGYHIHAIDGDIGHLEDFLVDDESWTIQYAIVNTKNWGFGNHVLVSSAEIKAVNWNERYIRLELTCYAIKSSSSWQEPDWSERPAP
jgi:hypothetical protein